MPTRKLFVIGEKDSGVVFVTLNPLRAAVIDKGTIDNFAATHPPPPGTPSIFGKIASAIYAFIAHYDSPDILVQTGEAEAGLARMMTEGVMKVSDADFCFVADLDAAQWVTTRNPYIPIKPALNVLADLATPGGVAVNATLDPA